MHAVLIALALAAAPPPAGQAGTVVTVKREGARLMLAARFYGKSCPVEVKPGQKTKVLERQRGWARVAAPGDGKCWLHESAWSDRTAGELAGPAAGAGMSDVELAGRGKPGAPGATGASKRDVELAARGFSEAEEARYRGEHRDLDAAFEVVEAHLARGAEPSPEALTRFAAEGGVEAQP
jgi:hypothetical protein